MLQAEENSGMAMIFTLGGGGNLLQLAMHAYIALICVCLAEAVKEWLLEHNQPGHVRRRTGLPHLLQEMSVSMLGWFNA